MSAGKILYAKSEKRVVIKLAGDIRYTLLPGTARLTAGLSALLDRTLETEPFESIILDLTEAEMIDSTHLGLLAKVAHFARKRLAGKVTLFSTNPDITQILRGVGFDQVFILVEGAPDPALSWNAVGETLSCDGVQSDARLLLEAHRALAELNAKNRAAFRNIVDLLEKELGEDSSKP